MIHGLLDQIEPGVSDEEDDETLPAEFVFTGKDAEAAASRCRVLVICAAGAASAFALQAFSLSSVPWTMRIDEEHGPRRAFPPPPKTPRFFLAGQKEDVVVAFLDSPVVADLSMAFSAGLLKAFPAAKEVIVLDRFFRANWVGRERPEEPYLCGLWSSAWGAKGPSLCAQLPQPNTLEGLPAAMLTHCEAARKRCLVAMAIQDGAHIGTGSVKGLEGVVPLLQELGVLASDWSPPSYSEAIRKVVPPVSMSIYA